MGVTYFWRPALKAVGRCVPTSTPSRFSATMMELMGHAESWTLDASHVPMLRVLMVATGERTWEELIRAIEERGEIDIIQE